MLKQILFKPIIQIVITYCLIVLFTGLKREEITTLEGFAIGTIVALTAYPANVIEELCKPTKREDEE